MSQILAWHQDILMTDRQSQCDFDFDFYLYLQLFACETPQTGRSHVRYPMRWIFKFT
jgi:hypothetical protein